ncbi:hypothetical protein [Nesterenkonia populi]
MAAQFQVRTDDPSQTLEEIWPVFGLRIESPRLVLRVLREADFPQYLAAASYEWNTASRRVSEKLGYQVCGTRRAVDAHRRSAEQLDLFRLPPEDFQKPEWPVEVEGSDRLRAFLESGGA